MSLCARVVLFVIAAAGLAAAQSPFGERLHENTTGAPDVYHVGVPDDSFLGIGMQRVTYDFFANGVEIFNGPGTDITVYEVDHGSIEFGSMDVLVSQNGSTFLSVKGTETAMTRIPGDTVMHTDNAYGRSYDIGPSGLAVVRFVRIQGTSTATVIDNICVGFDLDGVGAVNIRPITIGGISPAVIRVDEVETFTSEATPGQQDLAVLMRVRNVGLSDATMLAASLSFTGTVDRTGEYTVSPFAANPTICIPGEVVELRFDVDVAPGASLEAITVDGAVTGVDSFASGAIMVSGAAITSGWTVVAVPAGLQPVSFAEHAATTSGFPGFPWEGAPDDFYSGTGSATVTFDLLADATAILDMPGVDFNVYELDNGAIEFTGIDVLASADGITFISVKASETALVRVMGDAVHASDLHARSYDLSGSGLPRAYYIRVVGLGTGLSECNNGFDMDAIAIHSPALVLGIAATQVEVLAVTARDDAVAGGDADRLVEVTVANLGDARIESLTAMLSFTGSADRTSEYTVTPFVGNPSSIEIGATVTLAFAVDVDLLATSELITIDVRADAFDVFAMAPIVDVGATQTDTWQVDLAPCITVACGDCDQNGFVNILDALRAAQISAALLVIPTPGTPEFNDCNPSGLSWPDPAAVIAILDALAIAQFAAGVGPLACCQ